MSPLARELDFLLNEFLSLDPILKRSQYRDHTKADFTSVLALAEQIAGDFFAGHNAKGDENEPQFIDGQARTIPETGQAWRAFAEAGFLNAHWRSAEGGLQLPEPIFRAALTHFFAANVGTVGYQFLTIGAANLLRTFGTDELKSRYLPAMGDGRSSGTMALTEPGQGSALGDIKTYAIPQADGTYRIFGQKMFISGGDQDFTDNIVHMVLARIKGAPAGVKGISLFLVPKFVVNSDGSRGERNDVALAGLLHKMGCRNTTSTVLSFGERGGATGWLLGDANKGLPHMFQLMNEARIGVGLGAACLAYRGFTESLTYARERRQGRPPSAKDPSTQQVRLIEHADIRRLLLTQKIYSEGALALGMQASAWFEDERTHPDPEQRAIASRLLDLITPVVKSWSAKYGCRSNDCAIQVLGGSGYIREYPVEQLYRDQRLNPIHEGTEAIHGLDLLGRKVGLLEGALFDEFMSLIRAQIPHTHASLTSLAAQLEDAAAKLQRVTINLLASLKSDADGTLAYATEYLDAFGRVTMGWIWLRLGCTAAAAMDNSDDNASCANFYKGKVQAAKFYFESELPLLHKQLKLLDSKERAAADMKDEWFA